MVIDTTFDFRTDAAGKDPDTYSATLCRYHQLLWSKPLPSGFLFELVPTSRPPYRFSHRSEAGDFVLSSDAFIPAYTRYGVPKPVLEQLSAAEHDHFNAIGYTLGGLILWPANPIDRKWTINQARGCLRSRVGDRMSELAQRLCGDVLVRAPAGRGHPLAGRHDEAGGVLLGGDDDEGAAVELAGGLGAVDELPQPLKRGLRVEVLAVVDAQAAAAAVLARLVDVGAQLLDHEPDAAGGDPRDPLPGLGVGGAVVVGAEQRVDELCRPLDYADQPMPYARKGDEAGRGAAKARSGRACGEEDGLRRASMDRFRAGARLVMLADLGRRRSLPRWPRWRVQCRGHSQWQTKQ
jgi:hypothetical protein